MYLRKHSSFHRSILFSLVVVLVLGFAFTAPVHANTVCVNTDGSGSCFTDLQSAVDAASDGDNITVAAGTYTITSQVTVNKAVTISGAGAGQTIFQVSGTGYRLYLDAPSIVLENVEILKTDKTGIQNIVVLMNNDITVRNNTIHGQFVIGDPEVSRALEVAVGRTGATIEGNTIYNLRQPAYLNGAVGGAVSGTIRNNIVYGTKGWVVDHGLYEFTGNSWGDGSHPNYYDIAIFGPADVAINYPAYYGDMVTLSKANNNAKIENQTTSTPELVDVYVNAAAASAGNGSIIEPYKDLAPAAARVSPGGTVHVAAGTYTLTSGVTFIKSATITGAGAGNTIFKVSGAGPHFVMNAADSTLENVEIEKIDTVNEVSIISVAASNLTIRNNSIHGQFVVNGLVDETDRAMVVNAGVTGILIEGNTIYNLRQPAYLNGAGSAKVTGTIKDNLVYGTKGWVVASGLYNFVNNAWDRSKPNYVDIAIIESANVANNYPTFYGNLIQLSQTNNGAIIENQTVTPRELTEVFVDPAGSAKLDGTITQSYQTITPALTRVMAGGTIHVAAGNYLESLSIVKAGVKLLGAGKDKTTITGPKTGSSATLEFKANDILVDGVKITREGNNTSDWAANVKTSGVSIFDVSGVTLQNCEVSGNRNGVYFNGFNTGNNTVQNCVITNNRTGVNIFRGSTGNAFLNNEISNNWTFGVVFIPLTPPDTAVVTGFTFTGNRIFSNWYAQVIDRNNLDGLTPKINMKNNWFGGLYPTYSTVNIVEPGYAAQIPEQFGGTAKAPAYSGGIVDTDPDHSAIDYAPWFIDAEGKTNASYVVFMPIMSNFVNSK